MGSIDVSAIDLIPAEARQVLHGLASEWSDVEDCRDIEVLPSKWATTNQVFQIKWRSNGGGGRPRTVLLRIYGEGIATLFDREVEIRTFEAISRHGLGPKLLRKFPSGRVEEFIHARTLTVSDSRDPEISALIASKLREFHALDMPGPKKVVLWDRTRNWLKVAKSVCSSEEIEELSLDRIEDELSCLENELSTDQRIGFCHNDLCQTNIMMNEQTKLVTLIDYEYAGFNPVAYDFAHLFNEMAGDNPATPEILDYTKYPDIDERRRFVRIYLSSEGENPEDIEVENLVENIEKYVLVNHLYMIIWGVISEHMSDGHDFEFKEYSRQRFWRYWSLKKTNTPSCIPS